MVQMIDRNDKSIQNLNPEQLIASNHIDGPLLILAGAGTGKTKVLTHRIANLISNNHAAFHQILAVTFTNKAAREMQHRVAELIGDHTDNMSIGTFHSIAAKIMRQYASFLGFTSDFTIIDYDDQLRIVRKILKEQDVDDSRAVAKVLLYHISRFKDKAFMPGAVPESENEMIGNLSAHAIYQIYQRQLRALNAMDFGDLLLYNIELFNNNLHVLEIYQQRFKYILVDEYQDTNTAQYLWLRLLAAKHNNICCVGDDDQSIYGWRGAEITNILRFDREFEGAKIVRLEQNYRSTRCILEAASGVIAVNNSRHKKKLWTEGVTGDLIKIYPCCDDQEEARFVADEIDTLSRYKKLQKRDIAILLRAGYQTRSFEEQLNFHQIPYNVIGGVKFYERMEIRDALAYIRFLVNPQDMLAFERMITNPRRGIGQVSIQKIIMTAQADSRPFPEVVNAILQAGIVKGKGANQFKNLMMQFDDWRSQLTNTSHQDVVKNMLNECGYIKALKDEDTAESKERLDNIRELITSLSEYEDLKQYLEHISLITDTDNLNSEDRVSIMTIHAAKGLEFDTVFLGGWEEGIFPSQKAIEESGLSGIEEERRLAYVAITRAKQRLYITSAERRRIYGNYQNCIPSRFIDELPQETYEIINQFNSYNNGPKFQNANLGPKRKFDRQTNSNNKFRCGDRIIHNKFGKGTVVSINGEQSTVVFEQTGIKNILNEYLTKA